MWLSLFSSPRDDPRLVVGCTSLSLPICLSFAGDHGGAVIPVPIPNTEVKGSIAEGSASPGRARVGRRQLFYFVLRVCLPGQTRFSFLQKAGDVLRSPLRGVVADSNRPYNFLLIPKLQLPLQPFLSRGTFAAPFIFSHSSAFQPQ